MKEVKFSQNSWHWRLANTYGNARTRYDYETETDKYEGDICSYTRSVLLGALGALVLTAVLCLIAACFANFAAWIAAGIVSGGWVALDGAGAAFIALVVFVCAMAGALYLSSEYEGWKYRRRMRKQEQAMVEEEKPEGFVKAAYRKFKDKTCFRVEVA